MLGVGFVNPVEHGLDLTANHRERRPQLVTEIRQQLAALLACRFESFGHLIERRDHGPCGPAGPGDSHRVVAVCK